LYPGILFEARIWSVPEGAAEHNFIPGTYIVTDTAMTQPPRIESAAPSGTFSIVFVCSANLCRSRAAEVLTRRAIGQHMTIPFPCWSLSSAGTDVRPGATLPEGTAGTMDQLGLLTPSQPRQLDETIIAEADLILTAERSHRSWVVARVPAANRKTFTIRQFDRFCRAGRTVEPIGFTSSGERLMQIAVAGQALVQPVSGGEDDVIDPVTYRTAEAMFDCAEMLARCIEGIVGHATGNGRF
jgi:protein-tyrosine phosphatase